MKTNNNVHDIFLSRHNVHAHVGINCVGLKRLPINLFCGLSATIELYPFLKFYILISEYCLDYKTWKNKMKHHSHVNFVLCFDNKIPDYLSDVLQSILIIKELWRTQIQAIDSIFINSNNPSYTLLPAEKLSKLHSDNISNHIKYDYENLSRHAIGLNFPSARGERIMVGTDIDDHNHIRSILYAIAYMQSVIGIVHPYCCYIIKTWRHDQSNLSLLSKIKHVQEITKAKIDIIEFDNSDFIFSELYDILIMSKCQSRVTRDSFWQGCKFYDQVLTKQLYSSKWRRWLLNSFGLTKDLEYLSGYTTADYYTGELNLEIIDLPVVTCSFCNFNLISITAGLSLVADLSIYNTKLLLYKYMREYNRFINRS